MTFNCPFCPKTSEDEMTLNGHVLMIHLFAMPVCSNSELINQNIRLEEAVRRLYKQTAKKHRYYLTKYRFSRGYPSNLVRMRLSLDKRKPSKQVIKTFEIINNNFWFLNNIIEKEKILIE